MKNGVATEFTPFMMGSLSGFAMSMTGVRESGGGEFSIQRRAFYFPIGDGKLLLVLAEAEKEWFFAIDQLGLLGGIFGPMRGVDSARPDEASRPSGAAPPPSQAVSASPQITNAPPQQTAVEGPPSRLPSMIETTRPADLYRPSAPKAENPN